MSVTANFGIEASTENEENVKGADQSGSSGEKNRKASPGLVTPHIDWRTEFSSGTELSTVIVADMFRPDGCVMSIGMF